MPYDPLLAVFGDDPEALKEFERIRALRGDVAAAKRLQKLGAVGAIASDEGLRGIGENLYRTGAVQEDRYNEAMQQGYEGLKQTRSRAKEREEEKAWREKQHADDQAYRAQTLALQRAQEARMADESRRKPVGSWQPVTDEYTGETSFLNLTTGERRDSKGNPITGGSQAAAQPSGQGAPVAGAFGLQPTPYSTQAAGGPLGGSQPRALPRATQVKFKDRPGIEAEREKVRNALEQVAMLEQLYGASGGTGFGRGFSLPTDTAAKYDATVAQLAPLLTGMARTPGEGSQSDIEFKAKLAGMPYRKQPGDIMGQPEAGLEQNISGLRSTLEGRMQIIGAQLGMSQEEIQQMIDDARAAAQRVSGAPAQSSGLSEGASRYLGM